MNYGTLTYKAVVDWVELQIQLSQRSNFMTVQDALRVALELPANQQPFVEAMDETAGRSASVFRFRIQDPSQAKIDRVLAKLRKRFNFGLVQVVGIEVAFDTYRQGTTAHELAEIAADRYRFLTSEPGEHWYFYRRGGDGRHYINEDKDRERPTGRINTRRDLVRLFAEGWQLTDRDGKTADVRYRLYVKTTNDRQQLPIQAYRARLEVTLQGAALPCTTLDELAQFEFVRLADYFKFRRLVDGLPPIVRDPLTTWTKQQLGRRGRYKRPNRNKFGTYIAAALCRVWGEEGGYQGRGAGASQDRPDEARHFK